MAKANKHRNLMEMLKKKPKQINLSGGEGEMENYSSTGIKFQLSKMSEL